MKARAIKATPTLCFPPEHPPLFQSGGLLYRSVGDHTMEFSKYIRLLCKNKLLI